MLSSAACLAYVEWVAARKQSEDLSGMLRRGIELYSSCFNLDADLMAHRETSTGAWGSLSAELACCRFSATYRFQQLQRDPRAELGHRLLMIRMWSAEEVPLAFVMAHRLGELAWIGLGAGQTVMSMLHLFYLICGLWPDPDLLNEFVISDLPSAVVAHLPLGAGLKLGPRETGFGRQLLADFAQIVAAPGVLVRWIAPDHSFVRIR